MRTELGEEPGARSAEQPIENGELYPSHLNGGTVYVRTWRQGPREVNEEKCSGQVISRNMILTAAHCFYDIGYFEDGWVKKKEVRAALDHQNSNGSWEGVTNGAETMDVYIPETYFQLRRASSLKRWGRDIAVLQRRSNLSHTVRSDVAAIATDTTSGPDYLYVYGHGYHNDTTRDSQLRRGRFSGLVYDRHVQSDYFRTILAEPGPNDPHTCTSDSGGPWKTEGFGVPTQTSGVIFGVHVAGSGVGECAENKSRAAIVANAHTWIADRVREGGGSCESAMPLVGTSSGALLASTLICW